jgi:hypothetical protein
MMRPKYLLAVFVAGSCYAADFLAYLLPTTSYWLFFISRVCLLPLFFLSLIALIQLNRKAVAIFSIAWVMTVLPYTELKSVQRFRTWCVAGGLRIHAVPVKRYLSKCELIAFVEDGVEQQLGECETIWSIDYLETVFFDTGGQFALPPAQRTQAWRDAMHNFSSYCYLSEKAVAKNAFGKFYTVVIPISYLDGC